MGESLPAQAAWLALFFGCLIVRQVVDANRARHLDAFARAQSSDLRLTLARSLFDQGRSAISAHGSGSLATSLIEGVNQVRTYLTIHLPRTADLVVIPTLLAVFLLIVDPLSGIIALCIIPCIFFYMRMLGATAKEKATEKLGVFQRLANHFVDSLRGMQVIKAFGRGGSYGESVFEASESFREATVDTLKTATLSSLVLDLFRVFALAAVAIMLGFRLMAGSIGLLPALTVLIVVPELFAAVRRYSTDFHANLDGRNQLRAILDLIDQSPSVEEANGLQPASKHVSQLEIRNLSFAYPNAPGPSLDALSLSARRPERIGIVGASGAGKTTLVNLLAGFASPLSGSFEVNGEVLASLDCEKWRRHVTYIPQDPHVFHATLGDNIAFYRPDASIESIVEAARLAGLGELVAELPSGIDTVIGEAGRGLSGGQAQRIALARAFLDDRDVLVFDEPTAHLDIETELVLKKNMLPLMEGRLVFFATHRLHWMRDMDRIIVLDQGRIVQDGTLDELLAKDGPFLDFVASMHGEAV